MNPIEFFKSQNLNVLHAYVTQYEEWRCIVFGEGIECWGFGDAEDAALMDAYEKVKLLLEPKLKFG